MFDVFCHESKFFLSKRIKREGGRGQGGGQKDIYEKRSKEPREKDKKERRKTDHRGKGQEGGKMKQEEGRRRHISGV